MGWMNDTLRYAEHDPVHRRYHHHLITFSFMYAWSEHFVLPISHDEVVHGKQSMLHKMPGDEWQRFANLRLAYTYMFTHPGKKLLFMGTEFGQGNEWDSQKVLDWWVLQFPFHHGVQQLVRDLNRLYHGTPALYRYEFEWQGFEWIDCHDAGQSVLSYVRQAEEAKVVVALNFTPTPRTGYRIGVPVSGRWREALNSDAAVYGGSNMGNGAVELIAEEKPWMGRPWSLTLTLPPLAAVVLVPEPEEEDKGKAKVTGKGQRQSKGKDET
jgi:1,4-alpha-glucan branching enzyme